jgi:hypothetical protein
MSTGYNGETKIVAIDIRAWAAVGPAAKWTIDKYFLCLPVA